MDNGYLIERLTPWGDQWREHRDTVIAEARARSAASGEHVEENAILDRIFDSFIVLIENALRNVRQHAESSEERDTKDSSHDTTTMEQGR